MNTRFLNFQPDQPRATLSDEELKRLHEPLAEPTKEAEKRIKIKIGAELTPAQEKQREGLPCQDGGLAHAETGLICALDGMGSGGASEVTVQGVTQTFLNIIKGENTDLVEPFFSSPLESRRFTSEEALAATDRVLFYLDRMAQRIVHGSAEIDAACTRYMEKRHPLIATNTGSQFYQDMFKSRKANSLTTISYAKVFRTPEGALKVLVSNIGDSRIYRRRQGVWTQLSHDHAFAQPLIEAGLLRDEIDLYQTVERRALEDLLKHEQDRQREMADKGLAPDRFGSSKLEAFARLIATMKEKGKETFELEEFRHYCFAYLGTNNAHKQHSEVFDAEPGDEYYAFTDGLFENAPTSELERVRSQMSDNASPQAICTALNHTAQNTNVPDFKDDDITSVGMRLEQVA